MRSFPFFLGGGPDENDKAYRTLRSAVGVGGSATEDGGIDGLWRRAKAKGLAAGDSAIRRAILNFFPQSSTDTIPYYERILGIYPGPGSTLTDRRNTVFALWPAKTSARYADVQTALRRIDSRFTVLRVPDTQRTTARTGRCLAPHAGSSEPAYGTRHSSALARSSNRTTYRVRLDVGSQRKLTVTERNSVRQAKARLRVMLPSWCSFTITTTTGFVLGTSPLTTTGL